MSGRRPPIAAQLSDPTAERVRRSHEGAIRDWQTSPAASLVALGSSSLVDAVETPVAHGLGRAPLQVIVGPVRGASASGRVEEIRSGGYDRTKVIVLKATGYGATVAVDVSVL